jgi:hypothetical protein
LQLQFSGEELDYGKDALYEELCMEDVDLTFENYEELFGGSRNQPGQLFDDAGIDTYFEMKEASGADSDCQDDYSTEVLFFYLNLSFGYLLSIFMLSCFSRAAVLGLNLPHV